MWLARDWQVYVRFLPGVYKLTFAEFRVTEWPGPWSFPNTYGHMTTTRPMDQCAFWEQIVPAGSVASALRPRYRNAEI